MRKYLLLSFVVAGLAGCGDNSTPAAGVDAGAHAPSEQPVAPEAVENPVVDVAVNTATNEAVPFAAGQTLMGAFVAPRAGSIESINVVIGNNLNTSDGKLAIKLCQAGVCAEGASELAGSTDNAYFKIALSQSLAVTGDAPIEYTLTKDGGSVPVAIYIFPAQEGSGGTTNDLVTGAPVPRLPQFGLGYVQ